ncbi:uncharacterized protein LOC119459191 [Dermacentor silvarum]|uniref:uncharacterized protein LOC119459191 n=1 Tax=Dermacentor silvarum TaxID=543639 RepID=UPI00189BAD26|nr:uncharacterized protein LOC119459191 [Dermacentor silvarum]
MRNQPLLRLSILAGCLLCQRTGPHVCQPREVSEYYTFTGMANYVVSQQKHIRFYNTVLEVTSVCSVEGTQQYYQIIFTIAPTYCNSRIKYDILVCKPITTEAIGKCLAFVKGEPSDQQWNVTYFSCTAPDRPDAVLSPRA